MTPTESEQFLGLAPHESHRQPSPVARLLTTVFFVCCILFGIGALASPLLIILAYGQAMSAFGPNHSASPPSRQFELIGFILIGALPVLIYFVRRVFSRRNK